MADDFGLRLGIEGEAQFKAALRDINQAFKVLGSEMALVTSQFDKNDKSVGALTSRNEVLNKEIEAQKGKVETLRAALDNASASFGESDKRTQNWQIQLNKAQAELNGMERELSDNEKALHGFSGETDDSAENMDDASTAAGKLSKGVDDVGGEMDDARKKTSIFGDVLKANLLSDAIMGGIKAIGSAIKSIGSAFVDAMKDGVEYNAEMESYTSSFTTMLGDQAKAQKLVTDLKKEAAATPFGMQDLASAAQTLMSFGMTAEDTQKHMRELGDISQGNAEKFQSLTLAFAQASSTGKLTGQDLMQMINAGFNPLEEISRKTGKSIGELKEEMSKGGISAEMLSEAFASATAEGGRFYGSMESQSKTFKGQLATLEDGVSSLKGQLSEGLTGMLSGTALPMVNGWVDSLSAAFSTDGAQGLIDALGGIIQEAVGFISEQMPMIVSLASQIIISLVQGLTAALPQITSAAVTLLMTLISGLVSALPSIANAAVQMVGTIVSGIASALPELIPAAVSAVIAIVQGLLDNLPMILEAALQLVTGLTDGILAAIPVLIDALPTVILAIVDFVIGAIPQIIDAGIKLLVSLIQNLPTIITTIVKAIPQIISSLVNAIIGNIDKIILAGVQLFVSLIENLPTIIVEIVKAIPQIITGIVSAIGSLVYKLVEAGSNLIKGLWQGILNVKDWIWDKIKGFFSGIVDGIKNFFGIHSPSTLFAGLGANMGEGIGVGFENAMAQVSRDMRDAIPTDFDIAANVHGAYSAGVGGTGYPPGTVVNNNNISITSPKALSEKEAAREFKNLSRRLALGV